MSHHGSNPDEPESDILRAIRENMSKLNREVLGEYPNGKLNARDEGALAMAVAHEGKVVKIMFPKPVAWIGFTPEQAVEIANLLIQHAREAGFSRPVTIVLP